MKTVSLPVQLRSQHGIRRIAAALGVFDGVHIGHQRLLARVVALARAAQAVPAVITFDTHPRAILATAASPPLLTTLPQRLRLLAEYGMEAAVLLPFDEAMAALAPEAFVHTYLLAPGGPEVVAACIGTQWRFGRGGSGTADVLARLAAPHHCQVESVPEVRHRGRAVSSTRIREAVQAGRLDEAAAWLGRRYAVAGTVVRGQGLGSQLGYATANLHDPDLVLPPDGVYAAAARRLAADGRLPGILYVGTAPTFGTPGGPSRPRLVEVHLFEVAESLYGEEIEVEFGAWLRPDRRFATVAALRAQISLDVAAAKRLLPG